MIYYTATANARGFKAVKDAGTTRPSSAVSFRKHRESLKRHIDVVEVGQMSADSSCVYIHSIFTDQ